VLTLARQNKQKRDHVAYIPRAVADKLRAIKRFDERVFAWNFGETTLCRHFHKIQVAAGIELDCTVEHKHTNWCHAHGFHDFRHSIATLNDQLPASMKQKQMGHSSYATTQRYEKFAKARENFADKLYPPPSMQKTAASQ
jgi:integrase